MLDSLDLLVGELGIKRIGVRSVSHRFLLYDSEFVEHRPLDMDSKPDVGNSRALQRMRSVLLQKSSVITGFQ